VFWLSVLRGFVTHFGDGFAQGLTLEFETVGVVNDAIEDVQLAKPRIAISIRMVTTIFFPQQRQSHALAAQLTVNVGPVGLRLDPLRILISAVKQTALKVGVGHVSR
jgi:hypothetical protein